MKDFVLNPYSFDSYEVEQDQHGRSIVKAKLMKVGKLKYQDPSTGKEFTANISLDALKQAKNSCNLKSVTIKHPPIMLDGMNVKQYEQGVTASNAKIEEIKGETWLTNDIVLQTDKAVNVAREGKLGGSSGYFRQVVPTSKADEVEFTNINFNHYAIGCDNPRAEGAGISLDEQGSELATVVIFNETAKPKQEVRMKRTLNAVKIGADFSMDEVQIDYVDEADTVIEKMVGREKSLLKQIQKQQTSMDEVTESTATKVGELSGEIKALNAKVTALEEEKKNMMSMDEVDTHIAEISKTKELAKSLGVTESFGTVDEGNKLIVAKAYPDVSFDDSEIAGAIKTIKANAKDIKDQNDSKKALDKVDASMDDKGTNVVGLSTISIGELKKKIMG